MFTVLLHLVYFLLNKCRLGEDEDSYLTNIKKILLFKKTGSVYARYILLNL